MSATQPVSPHALSRKSNTSLQVTGRHQTHPPLRWAMFGIGKVLTPLLTRTTVIGRENIPATGPVIIVGNHSAYIEAMMMAMAMPWPIELMGAGDVPLHGTFVFLQRWWGYVPINRGEVDRTGLKAAASVLENNGAIGIFPEGGMWDKRIGDARLGVAYLSQTTQAPILPMGFGGVIGGLNKVVKLQRPKLTVHVGKLIPPVPTSENYRERKALAQQASKDLMDAIYTLVPQDDEVSQVGARQEAYQFVVNLTDANGQTVTPPAELNIPHGDDLSYFFHRPVLINVVIDNFNRPAHALRELATERDATRLAAAIGEALEIYTHEKRSFLGYRLGYKRAARVVDGLRALEKLAQWAADRHLNMDIQPQATFTYANGTVEQYNTPGAAHEL